MARRSYDHYCGIARALDVVGDRWTLLIMRELLAGRRRYTDLQADLPGISTDVLADRLRDLERERLVTRRKLPPPGTAAVYEVTRRGQDLMPVLVALADWGAPELAVRRRTDAVRAHWFAIPLMHRLRPITQGHTGVVNIKLDEGGFHLRLAESGYGDGLAENADVLIVMDIAVCVGIVQGAITAVDGLTHPNTRVTGEAPLADVLRGMQPSTR
jgi:DNA-binding HxlR family transcriptional regulator